MQTQILDISAPSIQQAASLLRAGQLVAFPTETVYGLGASALDGAAVSSIYTAKGRPSDNPLIAHVASLEQAQQLVEFTPLAERLASRYWPGPLTMVLPNRGLVAPQVSANLGTLAVRWPAHPVAQQLIRAAGLPIAAPSANQSGRPSPTLASHVLEDLTGRIPLILDGGAVEIGLESTVVDASGPLPVLLRPGRITAEELRTLCGGLLYPQGSASQHPPAPGMKYRHYAPQGDILLVPDWRAAQAALHSAQAQQAAAQGQQPLLLLSEYSAEQLLQRQAVEAQQIISLGSSCEQMAARLFAALRTADQRGAKLLIVETVAEEGLGLAIMNRLNKAAGKESK